MKKKWRSKNAHDKEAHWNKIKWPTSFATADCTEVNTKAIQSAWKNMNCTEFFLN